MKDHLDRWWKRLEVNPREQNGDMVFNFFFFMNLVTTTLTGEFSPGLEKARVVRRRWGGVDGMGRVVRRRWGGVNGMGWNGAGGGLRGGERVGVGVRVDLIKKRSAIFLARD